MFFFICRFYDCRGSVNKKVEKHLLAQSTGGKAVVFRQWEAELRDGLLAAARVQPSIREVLLYIYVFQIEQRHLWRDQLQVPALNILAVVSTSTLLFYL